MAPKVGTKEVIGVSVFNLILHLSMLIVGVLYNGEEHCKLEVSEYIKTEYHKKRQKNIHDF